MDIFVHQVLRLPFKPVERDAQDGRWLSATPSLRLELTLNSLRTIKTGVTRNRTSNRGNRETSRSKGWRSSPTISTPCRMANKLKAVEMDVNTPETAMLVSNRGVWRNQ